MVKITNIFGDRYSGQAGKAGVFANWKGIQYRRAYVIPSNPNSNKQKAVRDNLRDAVSAWHGFTSLMRKAYSYMTGSLTMSGFNLFVKRWQKAMPDSLATMMPPPVGIKCIGNTKTAKELTNPVPTNHSKALGFNPVEIGSLTLTKSGTDKIIDAYVEIQQGFVRLPLVIDDAGGANASINTLEEGDELCISYQSSGRIVTREVLAVLGDAETEFPAAATMALTLQTQRCPIDYGSVVIEVHDLDGGADEWTALESLEIDSVIGKVYFDLTDCADASTAINYNTYTPVADVKLEATKTDTTFIAWRDYSDVNGQLPLSFTVEDEEYDLVFTKTGYTAVLQTARTAALSALTEFIDIGVSA